MRIGSITKLNQGNILEIDGSLFLLTSGMCRFISVDRSVPVHQVDGILFGGEFDVDCTATIMRRKSCSLRGGFCGDGFAVFYLSSLPISDAVTVLQGFGTDELKAYTVAVFSVLRSALSVLETVYLLNQFNKTLSDCSLDLESGLADNISTQGAINSSHLG